MKKLLAILSAAVLLLSFAACGKKTNTTVSTDSSTDVQTQAVEPMRNTEQTTATVDAADEKITAVETSESVSESEHEAAEMTTEEIVKLYNSAVNRVKGEAKAITRHYSHVNCPPELVELPSAIEGLGKSAMKTFVKGSDDPVTWTDKADFRLGFPVTKEDYSSHLTADMVKTATIKEDDKNYKIELKLYDDKITSPKKGQGYAGVFNTVSASTFEEISIPTVTFNEVKINGINGSISVTIDKESRRVTDIIFCNTDIMRINVKVAFSTIDCKIGMINENSYSIRY